jgi:hypothetical protein
MEQLLKARINEELKNAMRSGDERRKIALRQIVAMIKNEEVNARTDGRGGVLSDNDVLVLIRREIKQHEESILEAKQNNRDDLVEEQEAEMVILRGFLPKQLTRDEIVELVKSTVAELGVSGGKAHGQVMKALQPKVKDIADGKLVNDIVRETLG